MRSHEWPENRITTTYPVNESVCRVACLVTGQERAAILHAILGDQLPAARGPAVGGLLWLVDRAGAGEQQMASRASSQSPSYLARCRYMQPCAGATALPISIAPSISLAD
jgi:Glucosamine-6-phosphate isomerases/6-phosphogluconolactonase